MVHAGMLILDIGCFCGRGSTVQRDFSAGCGSRVFSSRGQTVTVPPQSAKPPSLNLAIPREPRAVAISPGDSRTFRLASLAVIESGTTFFLLSFSPDGDPLGLVEICREEAIRPCSSPPMMGHVFRAARERMGIFIEPVAWETV